MKTEELIAMFKNKHLLKTNEEVAYVLKMDAGNLSSITKGKKPMPVPIKFRLLDHIEFTPDIKKVAACFTDITEHNVLMQEDEDRAEEVKNKGQITRQKYTNQKEIDRIEQLQKKRKISDEELAVFLETTVGHLKSVKEGEDVLNTLSKAILYLAIKGNDWIKRFIDLLPIKDETKQKWKDADDAATKKNLKKRLPE